jgi:hypothetical protein
MRLVTAAGRHDLEHIVGAQRLAVRAPQAIEVDAIEACDALALLELGAGMEDACCPSSSVGADP